MEQFRLYVNVLKPIVSVWTCDCTRVVIEIFQCRMWCDSKQCGGTAHRNGGGVSALDTGTLIAAAGIPVEPGEPPGPTSSAAWS